jgi:hypothetical protein
MSEKIPARVLAIAEKVQDEPLAWKEHADGSVTIVFCNKGKQTFEANQVIEVPAFENVIHTNEDAQEAVQTLAPTHKPSPKKKEK